MSMQTCSCSLFLAAAHRLKGDGSGDEEEQQKQVLVAGVERLPEQHSRQQQEEEPPQVRSSFTGNICLPVKFCKLCARPGVGGEGWARTVLKPQSVHVNKLLTHSLRSESDLLFFLKGETVGVEHRHRYRRAFTCLSSLWLFNQLFLG